MNVVLMRRIVALLFLAAASLSAAVASPTRAVAQAPAIAAPGNLSATESPPAAAPAEMIVNVREPVRIQSGSGPSPLWTAGLSGLAALLGAWVGYIGTTRNGRAAIIQKTNELEIESIERRLTEFVGPFLHLSEENKILAGELKRKQPDSENFRTLTALLTPGWTESLSPGDRNLLNAVVANGSALRTLISEKGGSAVSLQLMPYFAKASAHFRFLELAAAGSLDMDPARYSGYVYPRQLDGVMLAEQKRLYDRRETLRSKPDKPHATMSDLEIPADLILPDEVVASTAKVETRAQPA